MLAVLVDGVALPEAEARAMWERFSLWMEERRGDLAGFAQQEGFASVHPGVDGGKPVLLASRSAAQQAYGPAQAPPQASSRPKGSNGGSKRRQTAEPPRSAAARKPGKRGPTR